jgi:hypothetical protein
MGCSLYCCQAHARLSALCSAAPIYPDQGVISSPSARSRQAADRCRSDTARALARVAANSAGAREAQPATDRRAREAAEPITTRGAGSGPRLISAGRPDSYASFIIERVIQARIPSWSLPCWQTDIPGKAALANPAMAGIAPPRSLARISRDSPPGFIESCGGI